MEPKLHEAAAHHLPFFITPPGQTDVLMVIMAVVMVLSVLGIGVFFFWLHSLPERMVHNKVQFDLVAVLALLSLFTHIHAFWVAALVIALIEFPDFSAWNFSKPLDSMAGSLDKIAERAEGPGQAAPSPSAVRSPPPKLAADGGAKVMES